jgi:Ca2+/Na+ antiporter
VCSWLARGARLICWPLLPRRTQRRHNALPSAAVTLMAWGNGAPDIFSSMAAVKEGEYALALGGQLGT